MYYALYRKYRPRVFEDVIGQDHITLTLRNEVAKGHTAHSYLFTGSRGTGKTTCARILAKAVNCEHPVNGDPCLACDTCRGIEEGSVLDIVEIDAASNNGVDNIRDLKEEANFMPASAKMRVYIIDEVHMLSPGAFNALLKIMEEPPEHVMFILATTEAHKVLPTIISRCQRFDFHRVDTQVIADYLGGISEKEGIVLEPEAALTIAALADGGVRDAMSLLDQCMSKAQTITAQVVRESAGLISDEYLFSLSEQIASHSVGDIFTAVSELSALSLDPGRLCEQLISHYRCLMLIKSGCSSLQLLSCLPQEYERYQQAASKTSMPEILRTLRLLQDTLDRMGRVQNRRLELEMCLLQCASPQLDTSSDALLSRVQKLEAQLVSGHFSPAKVPAEGQPHTAADQNPAPSEPPALYSEDAQPGAPVSQEQAAVRGAAGSRPKPPAYDQAKPVEQWPDILQILSGTNPALSGALAGSAAYVSGEFVLIDFKSPLFSKIIREDSFAKETLRAAIAKVLGHSYRLGPYKPPSHAGGQEKREDPMEGLLQRARENGIEVIEK